MAENLQKPAKEGIAPGILEPQIAAKNFSLKRYDPASDLALFVDQHWIFRWDLPGQSSYTSEALPSPDVSLVLAPEGPIVIGLTTGKYIRTMAGMGVIIRTKFHPSGFYPFWLKDVSELTDKVLPASEVFPEITKAFADQLLILSDKDMIEQVEKTLRSRQPAYGSKMALVNRIIEFVKSDTSVISVKAVAKNFNMSERTLQNLLRMYVGIGPKWIIMRYRLREAAERTTDNTNWTQIAVDLGYSSQQHFTYDFKRIIGKSPSEYSKAIKNHNVI
jgi:AraC-like DNA-binding protein